MADQYNKVKVTVKLDRNGVKKLLQSDEIGEACTNAAQLIQARVGGYSVSEVYKGRNRVNVEAYADTPEDLLRALH